MIRPRSLPRPLALAVALLATPLALVAQAPPPTPAPVTGSQLFHLALVLASNETTTVPRAPLPKAVDKALTDIKDFLPYRDFRVIDSALLRGAEEAGTMLGGPDGRRYEASFLFHPDGAASPRGFVIDGLRMSEVPRPPDPGRTLGPGVAPRAPEGIISATFRIALGETVVVGSSHLDGDDRALILLLTAVP